MRDLLPDDMDRLRRVESTFAATARAWGYREIRTPVIEPLHLFTAAGTLSPQTLDRVYSFLDWDGWSGERVVLRPDSTIPAARLYAEQLDGGRIAKLFYRQNVFRFTDDGSSREEWQCGVELIGDVGRAGDVELVLMALESLRRLGLPSATVRLSHATLVRAVLAAAGLGEADQAAAYDRLLDGDLSVVDEIEAAMPRLNAALRLLFEVDGEGSAYITNIRSALRGAIPAIAPALDDLAFVVEALEASGVRPIIHSVLARSFEYYSGLVMRIDIDGRDVCAGGRYDELISGVGGKRVPASGFALYDSPLIDLLPAAPEPTPTVLVQPAENTPALVAAACAAADALRARGLTVEVTESMYSAPVSRVVCEDGGAFRISDGASERSVASIEELARALGQPS